MKQRVVVTFTTEEFAGLLGHLSVGDTPAEFLKYVLKDYQARLRKRCMEIGPLPDGEAP